METLLKLLICQLIIKDLIDITFIWQDYNYITIALNASSLLLGLVLLLFDYLKIQFRIQTIFLILICLINFEITFQENINSVNMVYFAFVFLILNNNNSQKIANNLLLHGFLIYFSVRIFLLMDLDKIHWILIFIIHQPINHLILYFIKGKQFQKFTQTIGNREFSNIHLNFTSKQLSEELDCINSNESKRQQLQQDLNESVVYRGQGDLLDLEQLHRNIGTNKDKMEERIIIKKSPENHKTTTNYSETNQLEPLKLESSPSNKYSEIVAIMNNLPFGILFIDAQLKILDLNQKVYQLLGLDNYEQIIPFLEEAIQSGEFCEFRSSKKIKRPTKTFSKNTLIKQASLSPQKKGLEEQIHEATSQYNNNISQFKNDSDINIAINLSNILKRFKKIHQSQVTQLSRDSFQYIIRLDNMNLSQPKSKYRSLKLKIFQLEGIGPWEETTYLFFLENITKREEYKLLNHKYKFQQALLNSLCHELRTPINGTISQLYALKDQLSISLVESHLDPAMVSVKRLQYQLNDILDYASIQCESLTLNKSQFQLSEIFNQLQDLFHFECIQKKINLIFEDSLQIKLYTDKERLIRIFINLLDNSVKFTNKGGTIKITIEKSKHYYTFTVEDDGQGITDDVIIKIEAQAELLFEDSIQYNSNKLGLGLRISQQLAKYLYSDQNFLIKSTYNLFTKVSFRVSNKIEGYSKDLEKNVNSYKKIQACNCNKILIVDDISCNHLALEVLLKKFKFTTDSAYNGNSAIELVKQRLSQTCCQIYRLIFMDIEMPGKNGFQASAEIKTILQEKSLDQRCIIIMYSAYSGDEDIQLANQCGMKERISKPTDLQKLESIINKYLL